MCAGSRSVILLVRWQDTKPWRDGFLFAIAGGRVYPFPFESSPAAEASARILTRETLSRASRFAIYGGDRNVRFWRNWFAARPELQDWQSGIAGKFGDVEIAVFQAPQQLSHRAAR